MTARSLRAAAIAALPWVAGAALGTLAVAAADAWREAAAQGWWRDGLRALVLDAVWRRFDPWAAGVGAGVLGLAILIGFWRRVGTTRVSRIAVAALALLALARLGSAVEQRQRAPGPNVLLISIDTLRADRLGAYGHALPTSPTLDRRLAAEGVTFDDVLSQSPKTTPSHMTMFTSLYPCVHGVTMWEDAGAAPILRDDVHTLAEVLKNGGWATAAFTAGGPMHASRGFAQGFDEYRHSRQLERTRAFLRAHRDQRFFVFFHTYEVHDPYTPPPELIARFDPDYRGPVLDAVERIRRGDAPGWEQGHKLFWDAVDRHDPRTVRFVERLYDAGIRRMDDGTLTSLLDELDALGLRDDTLVILTSDHGEAFGEHGAFLHDDLYRGTLHVPLVLRWPGHLPAGTRVAGRARVLDLMPTVLDLTGLPVPGQAQGRTLAAAARGATDPSSPSVFSEHGPALAPVKEAVRSTQWSLLRDGTDDRLFDLALDPAEARDLVRTAPEPAADLRGQLAAWRAECARLHARYGPGGAAVAPEPETIRQLRALGYVE